MEDNNLMEFNNEVYKKGRCYTNKCNIVVILGIFIIIILQTISLTYLIIFSHKAEKLDLYKFNRTDAILYINKIKTIINYMCMNEIEC